MGISRKKSKLRTKGQLTVEILKPGFNSVILSQSSHQKPPQIDGFWGFGHFGGLTRPVKLPVLKKKNRIVYLTLPELFF